MISFGRPFQVYLNIETMKDDKIRTMLILARLITNNFVIIILLALACGGMFFYLKQDQNTRSTLISRLRNMQFETTSPEMQADNIVVRIDELIKGKAIILRQDAPKLLSYIQNHGYLHPPSTLPYNLSNPNKDPSMGQSIMVKRFLNNVKNGFFVECGGLDGETRSNTLFFEKELGWQGLIIEADPKNFEILLQKQRKAWSANVCLAIRPVPHEVTFKQDFNMGKIKVGNVSKEDIKNIARVQCFPFFTLVSALNVSTVDYFSLDVEGHELEVLKTIPFHLIFIKVLSVEFKHVKGGEDVLTKFMARKGYDVAGKVTHQNNLANDVIFVHKTLRYKSSKFKVSKYKTN